MWFPHGPTFATRPAVAPHPHLDEVWLTLDGVKPQSLAAGSSLSDRGCLAHPYQVGEL